MLQLSPEKKCNYCAKQMMIILSIRVNNKIKCSVRLLTLPKDLRKRGTFGGPQKKKK
jgi:hypothetical protein